MSTPYFIVSQPRRKSSRMQRESQHVDRPLQQTRFHAIHELLETTVGCNERPTPIDRKGRIRPVGRQQDINGLTGSLEVGVVEVPFRKLGSKSACIQQGITFPQGD